MPEPALDESTKEANFYKHRHRINLPEEVDLDNLAFFPWTKDKILEFRSDAAKERRPVHTLDEVSKFYSTWSDAIAVASTQHLFVVFVRQASTRPPIQILFPAVTESEDEDTSQDTDSEDASQDEYTTRPLDSTRVAWCLDPSNLLEPLVVCTLGSIVVIFNLRTMKTVGCLRGHGGPITSISVHPRKPSIFCTTSRDHSTRICELSELKQQSPENDTFPPQYTKVLGSSAMGFQTNEPESKGLGRCVRILVGGRSGGHKAAVMHAAFHPDFPLIATAGLDRTVKIWYIPTPSQVTKGIIREDKPLFSSSKIHQSAVLSIHWLTTEMLLSHSAPSLLHEGDATKPVLGKSNLAVWRWLAFNQFFPPHQPEAQAVLRGSTADYLESASFRIIANYALPAVKHRTILARLSVARFNGSPYALFTYPELQAIRIIDISTLSPRLIPPFPWPYGKLPTAEEIKQGLETLRKFDASPLRAMDGWTLKTADKPSAMTNCAMGLNGAYVVGIHQSSVCIWTRVEGRKALGDGVPGRAPAIDDTSMQVDEVISIE
ncbi:hypothetical protein HGRIS_007982 [Hohenbuehelia grisea]|uniref:Uncharacterized protein n=1 Tax=Hohenbuehelia grisea TaxID=104357 RepID=A0ABR3J6Z9_9AGAR